MPSQLFRSTPAVAAVVAALMVVAVSAACSSSKSSSPACDDSKCLAGNKCLPLNGETKCRKTCSSNTDPASSCPFGYTCVSQDPEPFCVQDTTGLTAAGKGQFGTTCNPTGGITQNPDCDSANNFWCFGSAPSDATAYCTRYDCQSDRDCAATFYCGSANDTPNVQTSKHKPGDTRMVCQKRGYCAPCTADLDCPSLDGRPQRCVPDATTNANFCTPECDSNDACNKEAKCVSYPKLDGSPDKVCYPRAGVCVGDASLCSPCRSDADCGNDGICVQGQYSTERFCAKKSPGTCTSGQKPMCPAPFAGTKAYIACIDTSDVPQVPQNYCTCLYFFSDGPCQVTNDCPIIQGSTHEECVNGVCVKSDDYGCFTPNR